MHAGLTQTIPPSQQFTWERRAGHPEFQRNLSRYQEYVDSQLNAVSVKWALSIRGEGYVSEEHNRTTQRFADQLRKALYVLPFTDLSDFAVSQGWLLSFEKFTEQTSGVAAS